jgi:deoxyribodipyrimidine photo-lyase
MSNEIALVWFRQDLRLSDNPALCAAIKAGVQILPIYILDDANAGEWQMGAASRVWLHHALHSLQTDLSDHLYLNSGDALTLIPALAKKTGASSVYWNRCYEPWRVERDIKIKQALQNQSIETHSFNGSLLWEPWDVLKSDKTPYKVFTPFYKNGCLSKAVPRTPLPKPNSISLAKTTGRKALDDLKLLPAQPRWDKKMVEHWAISEAGAQERLNDFLDQGLKNYKEGRNHPDRDNVSRLSPYLHFGMLSPNQAWHASAFRGHEEFAGDNLETFHKELGWREFSYHLLYHFPTLPRANIQSCFDNFPWDKNPNALQAWQSGQTGYPIIDAAMRELWHTGYMHNRARMIVGSFLCKHLLLHWHHGAEWFWDCLFDADLANNSASWQWIAGSGADAAPYFRIFNPMTQGEEYDPNGDYIRRWVPEIADLPNKYLNKPWTAPQSILQQAGISLGKTYPKPIVDHTAARQRALEAFGKTK